MLLGRAHPVIPPNLYSILINKIAWGPQVICIQSIICWCILDFMFSWKAYLLFDLNQPYILF